MLTSDPSWISGICSCFFATFTGRILYDDENPFLADQFQQVDGGDERATDQFSSALYEKFNMRTYAPRNLETFRLA